MEVIMQSKYTIPFVFLFLNIFVFSFADGQEAQEPDLVIIGARLIDGTGSPPVVDAVIVIRNGTFASVGTNGEVPVPKNAELIDVEGKTVIPGLIDAHVHFMYPPTQVEFLLRNDAIDAFRAAHYLHRQLMGGITTVRDVSAVGNVATMAKKAFEEGLFVGSRPIVVEVGINGTNPAGNLWTGEADGPHEFRQLVRENLKAGADLIKVLPPYSREEMKAAIEETHAHEKLITVHNDRRFVQWAIELGADCIEHSGSMSDDLILMMAEKGIFGVPTLGIQRRLAGGSEYLAENNGLSDYQSPEETFRKMKEAGIRMAVGTDAIFHYLEELPGMYFEEIELFVKNGYTPMEAIVAATQIGAEVSGAADKLGTIEEGKIADLLVINGDPLDDIRNLRDVEIIIQDGKVIAGG
jgi:imidazolonepropionase-like amidohydrolase